jgi:DNA helicase-2/ATP-dependent DNA helicase PcrA
MPTLFDLTPEEPRPSVPLNEAQRRAVEHKEGPLLVIAGAGTGKTRVITERIRHLLATDPGLSGENILGLTFTDKAAAEMLHRVKQAVGERAKGVTLQTFHAFCKDLLSHHLPDHMLLENTDHWILLRRNMARLKLEKFRRLAEPGQFLSDFVEFFSRCQDELVSPVDYQRYADGLREKLEGLKNTLDENAWRERAEEAALQREVARAYGSSEALLREKKKLTFGALLARGVALLTADVAMRASLCERFHYILVDEFQDTNIAQLELLWLLSSDSRNVVVVGDNDQAIYRFRGASYASLKLFLQRFGRPRGRGATSGRGGASAVSCQLALTENYRSTPNILRVATQVISQNEAGADFPKKTLLPTRQEGKRVRIAEVGSKKEEALWVAGEMLRLRRAGHAWGDFAVLYRQHAHRDELVAELRRHGIPFHIRNLSILEHPLVRDVVAYLRLFGQPSNDVAAARVLSAPAWGFTPVELVRLAERAGRHRGSSFLDVLAEPQSELPFAPTDGPARELVESLATGRKALRERSASEALSWLLEWLEVHERAGEQARRYVSQLEKFVGEWEKKSETRGLIELLEYLDYFEQASGRVCLEEDPPGDAVQLMTVHAAKGLEFSHVFILRMNQNEFPVRQRRRVLEFPEALMKEELPQGDFHIQEERRLFYVALTRARDRLTLTTVADGKSKPSVFLDDMLLDPAVKRRDIMQIVPRIPLSPVELTDPKPSLTGPPAAAGLFPAATAPRIFCRIAEWAETFRPPRQEPLQLSASAIDVYRGCPQRYFFSRRWSLPEGPRAAMSFGSVMHTTIKRFVGEARKGRALPFEDLAAIYEQEWTSAGYEDNYQEAEYKREGLEQLRAFHAAVTAAKPAVLEQEKAFELPLDNNVIITGRMDQINTLGKRDVEIVDYKTGRPKPASAARKDLQLSLYALAVREVLELNPARLVFHYLQTNEAQVMRRDAKQLAEAEAIVQEVAADIRAGDFGARPGHACRTCPFKLICPAHEEPV